MSSDEIQIDDLWDYDPMTSDSGKWIWDSIPTKTYSNTGCRFITDSQTHVGTYNKDLPDNYEIEATFNFESTTEDFLMINQYAMYFGTYQSINRLIMFYNWPPEYYVNSNRLDSNITLKFKLENNILQIIHNNIVLLQGNVGNHEKGLALPVHPYTNNNSRIRTIKDIKIRKL